MTIRIFGYLALLLAFLAGCTWFTWEECSDPCYKGQQQVFRPTTHETEYIYQAVQYGFRTEILRHLELGENINERINDATPLYWAVWSQRHGMAEFLMQRGADPAELGPNHINLVTYAVWKTDPEMVELLLKYGANLNTFDANGRTPLHYAIDKGAVYSAELLMDRGAAVNVKDFNGVSPLDLARGRQDGTAVLIRQHGGILGHPRQEPPDEPPAEAVESAKALSKFVAEMDDAMFGTTHSELAEERSVIADRFRITLKDLGTFTFAATVLDVRRDPYNGTAVAVSWPFGVMRSPIFDCAPVLPLRISEARGAAIKIGSRIVVRGTPEFYFGAWNAPKGSLPLARVIKDWPKNETYDIRWSLAEHSYGLSVSDYTFDITPPAQGAESPSPRLWGTTQPVVYSAERAKRIYPQPTTTQESSGP